MSGFSVALPRRRRRRRRPPRDLMEWMILIGFFQGCLCLLVCLPWAFATGYADPFFVAMLGVIAGITALFWNDAAWQWMGFRGGARRLLRDWIIGDPD